MRYIYKKYVCTEVFIINDILIGNKGDILEVIDAIPKEHETREAVKGYCDIKNLNTNQVFNATWLDVDDDGLTLIEQNELLIYNGKAKEWTDLVDVCSPQECADLFGKPVKDGEIIYYPKTKEVI